MIRPGGATLVTDVPGILAGNAEDHAVRSGVAAVLPKATAVCPTSAAARPARARPMRSTRPV
jgi:L-aminopeptidase/D-esterase-like protein